MKTCYRCKTENPPTNFYKNKSKKDGLNSLCKACSAKNLIAYRAANKDYVHSYNKQYRAKNTEYFKGKDKCQRVKHKESRSEQSKKWANANKQKIVLYGIRERQLLSDNYIKTLLRETQGLTREKMTNELIEAKRLHLQIVRKLKELKA